MATEPPRKTILVVDDDEGVTRVLEHILTAGGYRVLVARSAEEALRHLDGDQSDAIVLDLRMPFIDGLGLLYRIRARDTQPHIPVLILTGDSRLSAETLNELSALEAPVQYKPIDATKLLAELRTMLRPTRES